MLDVTLEEIKKLLGEPTRVSGHQYYFRCPVCSSGGGDTHGDNLLFNDRKRLIKCFACDEGASEVLRMINASRKETNYVSTVKRELATEPKLWWKENLDNLYFYQAQAEEEMDSFALDWLYRTRFITPEAVKACGWGLDNQPNMLKIGTSVVIPLISINHRMQLVGFELRQIGDKKIIKHTLDAPRCLCAVWGRQDADYLIICEGFMDAISLYMWLGKKRDNYFICSPAHGCKDILHNLDGLLLSKYKKRFLLLDNDKAGDEATQQILEKYPFFEDKRSVLKGCEDISDFWVKRCQSN